ncbi:hypothetical protein OOK12_44300 [Streptomyces sp. NBC_00452]|uniref:hypothetical protein n=1 Tax=Streptomyces sp. NBC_00452 TaxID=2975746 RepID=UPI00225B68E8|nr:hypothetical protein [Streptomyces sp. NBC_00452]MCX5063873.1 hypothetical protein [Streptomyces sp. NBC_00452]
MTRPSPPADSDSTPQHEQALRRALARTAHQRQPSAAPVQQILKAGRSRRAHRRAAVASAGAILAVCLTVTLFLPGTEAENIRPQQQTTTASSPRPSPSAVPRSVVVGRGVLGGEPWSVTLTYYATFPKGFTPPSPSGLLHSPAPKGHSLLCTNVVIDGAPEGHTTDPWAGCTVVDGTRDTDHTTGASLEGNTDKGNTGSRLFLVHPDAAVAHATMTFRDGRHATAKVAAVPGTAYRAYAIPIASGQSIAAVDEYDAHNRLLNHNTQWR